MMNVPSISTSPPFVYVTPGSFVASPPGRVISYCSRFHSALSFLSSLKNITKIFLCQYSRKSD